MHDFRKLAVWNKSKSFVTSVYKLANQFPSEELFGLTSQIKRSAISVPSNIAEGCGRGTDKQLIYHLDVALGSAFELETQIGVAGDLEYVSQEKLSQLIGEITEIEKMIIGLRNSISKKV